VPTNTGSGFSIFSIADFNVAKKSLFRSGRSKTMRVKEAAEYLGVSPWTLRRYVHAGQLSYLPGKVWRFVVEDLDKFLEQGKETREVL
jgi:excisionase family DNA binding protein